MMEVKKGFLALALALPAFTLEGSLKEVFKKRGEYVDFSPTETFAIVNFEKFQLDLNRWCVEQGGTPVYCFKDAFGDTECTPLYEKGKVFYASDLYLKPKERFVECKTPDGQKLYEYRAYPVSTGFWATAGDVYVAFWVEHVPTAEDYFVKTLKVPRTSLEEMPYTRCRGNYCYSKWKFDRQVTGMGDFGNMMATYLYCKFRAGGSFEKDGESFKDFFKRVFLEEGLVGKMFKPQEALKAEGIYSCEGSFKVKVKFYGFNRGTQTAVYDAVYKLLQY